MKKIIYIFMVIPLFFSLISCNKKPENTNKIEKNQITEKKELNTKNKNISEKKEEEAKKEGSLEALRESLKKESKDFGVAYLGISQESLKGNFKNWIKENNPKLYKKYNFIENLKCENIIPRENNGGEVFLFITADPKSSIAVNRLTLGDNFELKVDEILYKSDFSEEPLLLVSDSVEFPDVEVNLVPEGKESIRWNPLLMWDLVSQELSHKSKFLDLSQYGEEGVKAARGFLYDSGWRKAKKDELKNTTWNSQGWYMDLTEDKNLKGYDGNIAIYQISDKDFEQINKYSGTYIVSEDKLILDIKNKDGKEIKNEFDFLILQDSSFVIIQKSLDKDNQLPFFEEDQDFVQFIQSMG